MAWLEGGKEKYRGLGRFDVIGASACCQLNTSFTRNDHRHLSYLEKE